MDLRQYDPAIGRWVVQDPTVHHDFSPYSAFDNNPVYWSDPSGANSVRYNWDTGNYDVFGKNDDLLGSFDAEQFGNYLNNPEAFAAKFYAFSDFDENNGNGGGGGNGKNKGANSKGIGQKNWQKGFSGMSGVTFFGAPVRLIPFNFGASSYFGGAINIYVGTWKKYLKDGLDSYIGRHLMHEYGHYLQEKYTGKIHRKNRLLYQSCIS